MSFLLQRRSKAAAPTPDPPVRQQVPDSGVIQASVLVVPPDGLVCKTGMKYEEFDVKSLSPETYFDYEKIYGVVQVAQCNSGAIIIADIVSVPMKDEEQFRPETWYLSLRHAWKYPVICGDALLLARSKAKVDQHHSNSVMQPDKDYKSSRYYNINMKSGVVDDDREEEFGSSSKMSLRADRVRLMTQNTTTTNMVYKYEVRCQKFATDQHKPALLKGVI
ncbi:uncharacterized protein LACBIDRAFT_330098 [Laccaria bicolor S238N-H82]|uniref:Predicted protein n=1 Tax=Laccaria bicolor (strain S238N-H82 / ATCC MYA-4686) TaxID=486041 RepID=B0DKA2_LACBS|nr:uncharacterized protein LACBIDRAFT_330098 [Laccaria bicolor S238N-H82]EDR05032.1 predicted protein [Laccaria bicolor S238N-H82]|eukprot:XP_001884422.1 predicted protein [Laccaria bicolor S238N-H82]